MRSAKLFAQNAEKEAKRISLNPSATKATQRAPISSLMTRIRHCVECPKCLTRYLIAFSPYSNGTYLVPTVYGSSEEYTLYCSCSGPPAASRWRWSEMKTCEVSKGAYDRGYGTPEEILPVTNQPRNE